jgi:hypothetical protein
MFQSVEDFCQRFYYRAPTIASKMVRSPEMMKRRPREGIEFLKFLRQRGAMGYRLCSLAMLLVAALASSVKAARLAQQRAVSHIPKTGDFDGHTADWTLCARVLSHDDCPNSEPSV